MHSCGDTITSSRLGLTTPRASRDAMFAIDRLIDPSSTVIKRPGAYLINCRSRHELGSSDTKVEAGTTPYCQRDPPTISRLGISINEGQIPMTDMREMV